MISAATLTAVSSGDRAPRSSPSGERRRARAGLATSVARARCDPALVAHVPLDSADGASRELLGRFERGVDHLLERVHADGVIRADAERRQLIALLHGLLATVADLGDRPGGQNFAVDLLLRGLAAAPAGAPLAEAQLMAQRTGTPAKA